MINKKNRKSSNSNNSSNSSNSISSSLMNDLIEAGKVMDELFNKLEIETGNFVGTIISGFHSIGDFFNDILKMLGSFGGKNDSGDFPEGLLSFLPGGDLIGGLIGLLGGMSPGPTHGNENGFSDIAKQPDIFSPNITVVVNSEIESSKAVKFLTNYMPVYNVRSSGSAI